MWMHRRTVRRTVCLKQPTSHCLLFSRAHTPPSPFKPPVAVSTSCATNAHSWATNTNYGTVNMDQVLVFDTASLAEGDGTPLLTLGLSTAAPPRALSWGRDHVLLVVRADKKAVVARIGGGGAGAGAGGGTENGGRAAAAAASLAVEDVADGRQEFTAGCFLGQGSGGGGLALGTCKGDVEVYGYGEVEGGGGGGLSSFEGKAPLPVELDMKGVAEVWFDSTASRHFSAGGGPPP